MSTYRPPAPQPLQIKQQLPRLRPYPPNPLPTPEPGLGDDVPCVKCGAVALDTGLECTECGHDNYAAVYGAPFVREVRP